MNLSRATLKRSFLIGIVTSLVVSAFMGIIILLTGNFDDTDGRILITTLVVGLFSITSLASLRLIESDIAGLRSLSWGGILISLGAFVSYCFLIWGNQDWFFGNEGEWKAALTLTVVSVSVAHATLLIPLRSRSKVLNLSVTATVGFIGIVAAMIINLILVPDLDPDSLYYRLLGVFAILDVLGTIVLPILAKFTPKSEGSAPLSVVGAAASRFEPSTDKENL